MEKQGINYMVGNCNYGEGGQELMMVDYMLQSPTPDPPLLSFADAMAQPSQDHQRTGMGMGMGVDTSAYFLKFPVDGAGKNKRKRVRTVKTSEEVESQRMTHIAVERNRRKQMNEHLRVLRSLMPNSYVQRGDQASIIGGAIEFVRELEQLLQCLESQKRRRLIPAEAEERAESKSCLADVEVKVAGYEGLIKILSRRREGQLIKTIAALEQDLQLCIVHTNITTIDQTVLYSFNVKVVGGEEQSAQDLANSIQQIFSFINAN
ncbi:hypothetical protein M569_07862 [Genlisea aurea]|uniref:BHLH domain-containing protein n=1 Tax=Genlisea aurea TaxID=192259 RepID=S8CJR8_9LAMI|nr:hypothetical protein M569_07862 [Genlisea aurea]